MPDERPGRRDRSPGGALDDEPGIYIDPRPPQPGRTRRRDRHGLPRRDDRDPAPDQRRQGVPHQGRRRRRGTPSAARSPTPTPRRRARDGGPRVSVDARPAPTGSTPGAPGGAGCRAREQVVSFPMTVEDGEWRIAAGARRADRPGDVVRAALPARSSLYFFDPTAQILVPEPVFVPEGDQLATALVEALLRGPGPRLARVVAQLRPARPRLGSSVPVSDDGVADISLKGGRRAADRRRPIELMLAQLAWTLRQEPAIRALRVSIGGEPVQLPAASATFRVDQGAAYDPTGFQASSLLYGLRDGRLVSGPAGALDAGRRAVRARRTYGLRSSASTSTRPRWPGCRATAARCCWPGPRTGRGRAPGGQRRRATCSARPGTSPTGCGWSTGAAGGARVVLRRARPAHVGARARRHRRGRSAASWSRATAPGWSPWSTGRGRRPLMVSRIRHDDQGRVLGATRARPISLGGRRAGSGSATSAGAPRPRSPSCTVLTGELSQVRTHRRRRVAAGPRTACHHAARAGCSALAGSPVDGREPATPSRGPA